jgi:hypothetical protein
MLRAAAVGTAMMLTAAGCKQSNDTPSVPEPKSVPVFTDIKDLQTYLAEQSGETTIDKPIAVRLSAVDLSEQETSIENLFAALADAGKYVSLDLSECKELAVWERYGAGADRVVSLVLPDSVAEIAESTYSVPTFASFTSLKAFTANKTETVGDYAFYNCAALASINLPSATVIRERAFRGCAALETAILPAATIIGGYAFAECHALTSVNLPAAGTIEGGAFQECIALTSINFPSAVTIAASAFSNCPALASADLPVATDIEAHAFSYCVALTSVNLPSATDIGDRAFNNCTALVSVSLPSAKTIEARVFYGCTALASVNIPAATDIGQTVFFNCSALASANLPAAATIGTNAFRNCYALESLTLGATPPELGATVFYDAGKDTEGFTIYVPDEAAKTALKAAIDDDSSDWYTAFTDIGDGNFKEVKVT